jgi:hypothetical protein
VRAPARERGSSPLGRDGKGVIRLAPFGEREREAGGEAVARAVRVAHRSRRRHGIPPAAARLVRAAGGALGPGDQPRLRIELACVTLRRVARARDERIEDDPAGLQRRELACRRDEDAGSSCRAQRPRVARAEVDRVVLRELGPRKRLVAPRPRLLADERDRPLPRRVDEREAVPLRLGPECRLDTDAATR